MTLWFYSDPHFGQDMSKFEHDGAKLRPMAQPEMDELIFDNYRALVKPQDHVYCLGDFAMSKEHAARAAARLHGHKRLILGNHDIHGAKFYLSLGFKKVVSERVFEDLLFTHRPVAPWSTGGRINVHGHCHKSRPMFYTASNPEVVGYQKPERYINISMEWTNYRLVSLEMIREWAASWR